MKPNYYEFREKQTGSVPLDTVDWTPPDDYVVEELTEEQWAELIAKYRRAGV